MKNIINLKRIFKKNSGFFLVSYKKNVFLEILLIAFSILIAFSALLFLLEIKQTPSSLQKKINTKDEQISTLMTTYQNSPGNDIFFGITFLGEWYAVLLLCSLASLIFWFNKNRNHIFPLLFGVFGSIFFVMLGKSFFERPRPQISLVKEEFSSFPSLHSTIAVVFYGFMGYIYWRQTKNILTKSVLLAAGIFLILAIGFSRLYLNVHYLSDVVGGFIFGIIWLVIMISLNEIKIKRLKI